MYKRYYKETNEDYVRAGEELQNPFKPSKELLAEAKLVYNTNCKVCHGDKGEGDGSIVQSGAYPPVPAYKERLPLLKEGQMFHSITYGKNLMGSYSSQITVDETWKVILYIQKLAEVGPFSKETEEVKEGEEASDEAAQAEEETTVAIN